MTFTKDLFVQDLLEVERETTNFTTLREFLNNSPKHLYSLARLRRDPVRHDLLTCTVRTLATGASAVECGVANPGARRQDGVRKVQVFADRTYACADLCQLFSL